MKHIVPMRTLSLLLVLSLSLAACSGTPSKPAAVAPQSSDTAGSTTAKDSATQAKPLVVTTVAPLTNIVSNIAGERAQVAGIIPEGTNSHTFEPRPSDGDSLAKANLILANGLDLEDPSINLAKAVKPKGTEIYELGSNAISRDKWVFDNSFPATGGKPNPHLWVSTAYAEAYAKESTKQLSQLDPEGSDYYQKNLDAYLARLKELDRVTRQVVESIPAKNRKLLTYHDSWPFPATGGKPNPHLWVSTAYAEAYAKESTKQLSQLDPEGSDYYQKNLDAYLARLKELDRVTRQVVESIPAKNRKLLTYHDSWPYWAKQYGFEVIGAIQPSDFNEPSAQDVAALIDQIRETGVPAIFGSEVFPSKVEEQIAQEAKVKLANTSDDDLPGDGSANAMENDNPKHTYIGMMADNLRILADNLGGDSSLVDQLDTTNVVGPTATKS